jgi:hypothetical protein
LKSKIGDCGSADNAKRGFFKPLPVFSAKKTLILVAGGVFCFLREILIAGRAVHHFFKRLAILVAGWVIACRLASQKFAFGYLGAA